MTIDFNARLRQRREDKKMRAREAAQAPPLPPEVMADKWQWTDGQQQAIHDVELLFKSEEPQVFVLTGAAGTGKTTVCDALGKILRPYWCAMTHKAAAIMSEKVGKDVVTLARALKLRKFNDLNLGKTEFKAGGDIEIPNRVVGIDESSMMDKYNFQMVKERLVPNHHVLLIGDMFQLPPVDEELSKVFQMDVPMFHLLEPVRFDAGSGIDRTATAVRNALEHSTPHIEGMREILRECKDVEFVSSEEAAPMLIEAFKQAEDVDDVRMISFTNARVEQYNYHLKKAVTGDADKIKAGDILMANAAYSEYIDGEEVMLLQNNQSVRVRNVEEVEHLGVPAYRVTIELGKRVYMPQNLKQYLAHVETLRTKALTHPKGSADRRHAFRAMFEFKDAFADLRLNYAQTVHKAQGSTYQWCFFDLNRLDTDSTLGRRLLYTGITRAAKRLVLFK